MTLFMKCQGVVLTARQASNTDREVRTSSQSKGAQQGSASHLVPQAAAVFDTDPRLPRSSTEHACGLHPTTRPRDEAFTSATQDRVTACNVAPHPTQLQNRGAAQVRWAEKGDDESAEGTSQDI